MVNDKVKGWIERLGHLWVEGQITQVNMKPSWKLSYITLRDVEQEASVQVTLSTSKLAAMQPPLQTGDRVIMHGKPAFYAGRASFSLWVTAVRHVGIGELLARIVAGEIDPSTIISHRGTLDDGPGFYETFRDKRNECFKCVMTP